MNSTEFQVIVERLHDDVIQARWLLPLGQGDQALALENYFDKINGVEDVRVYKYSATLRVATHVANIQDIQAEVKKVLELYFQPCIANLMQISVRDLVISVACL